MVDHHPHATHHANTLGKITTETRLDILVAIERYLSTMDQHGRVLFPTHTDPEAANRKFVANITASNLLDRIDYDAAIDDFCKFVNLGLPFDDTNFCPTLVIDLVWHAVMTVPKLKGLLIRYPLPHCVESRPDAVEEERYRRFRASFRNKYGRMPYEPSGMETVPPTQIQNNIAYAVSRVKAVIQAEQDQKRKEEQTRQEGLLEQVLWNQRREADQIQAEREWAKKAALSEVQTRLSVPNLRPYELEHYETGLVGKGLQNYARSKQSQNTAVRSHSTC